MNDKAFLQYALEQSFLKPVINSAYGLAMSDYSKTSANLAFNDMKHKNLTTYFLKISDIKKRIALVAYDVKNSKILHEQYELYKHDVSENIIIPDNTPELKNLQQQYNMVSVNRQSAQKKKVMAAIMPADYDLRVKEAYENYFAVVEEARRLLDINLVAENISKMNDFAGIYKHIMNTANSVNPLFLLNRKRLILYINEAAQILKSEHPLAADFCETHSFWGENICFFSKSAKHYKNELQYMISLLKNMAHEPKLLGLAQTLFADRNKYIAELNAYRNETAARNITEVTFLRHNLQKLFNLYCSLVYLDGVRFAFENQYLNECPVQKHQALPTVAPQEELKKIGKIVQESTKIRDNNSKIRKVYVQALNNFNGVYQEVKNLLDTVR